MRYANEKICHTKPKRKKMKRQTKEYSDTFSIILPHDRKWSKCTVCQYIWIRVHIKYSTVHTHIRESRHRKSSQSLTHEQNPHILVHKDKGQAIFHMRTNNGTKHTSNKQKQKKYRFSLESDMMTSTTMMMLYAFMQLPLWNSLFSFHSVSFTSFFCLPCSTTSIYRVSIAFFNRYTAINVSVYMVRLSSHTIAVVIWRPASALKQPPNRKLSDTTDNRTQFHE